MKKKERKKKTIGSERHVWSSIIKHQHRPSCIKRQPSTQEPLFNPSYMEIIQQTIIHRLPSCEPWNLQRRGRSQAHVLES